FSADLLGEARELGDALTTANKHVAGELGRLFHLPASLPTPRNLRNRRAIARLDDTIYRLIRERRADPTDRGDVLSMLCLARDEDGGPGLDDRQIRDEAMTIFLAGHE